MRVRQLRSIKRILDPFFHPSYRTRDIKESISTLQIISSQANHTSYAIALVSSTLLAGGSIYFLQQDTNCQSLAIASAFPFESLNGSSLHEQQIAREKYDDLMQRQLLKYQENQFKFQTLKDRFQFYASKTIPKLQQDGSYCNVQAMTVTDFLHSIVLPNFHLYEPDPNIQYTCEYLGNAEGIMTYEEVHLLLHLLQIPKEHFPVAFQIFDLDGDGIMGKDEFHTVISNLLRSITTSEDSMIETQVPLPCLMLKLFGKDGKKTIKANDFQDLLDEIRYLILRAEFDLYRRDMKKDIISVHDFALTLVSNLDPNGLQQYLNLVEPLLSRPETVSFEEFVKFHYNVQSYLPDIQLAFELTEKTEITETDFIHAIKVVTNGIELSFPLVQLVFRTFDIDGDGTLNRTELLNVLKARRTVNLKITSEKKQEESKVNAFITCMNEEKKNTF